MRRTPRFAAPSLRATAPLAAVGLSGVLLGLALAGGPRPTLAQAPHADAPMINVGVKAPIAEVMHCPLAFAGVHLLKDMPEHAQVAMHYCKPVNDDLAQCLLYDGTGPDARLIGVEYLVPESVYAGMPAEEQAYWHDHAHEVDAGLLRSLTQAGADEKAALAKVRTLRGKIFHTWSTGTAYPRGPARLFWSVTGRDPFVLPAGFALPGKPGGAR